MSSYLLHESPSMYLMHLEKCPKRNKNRSIQAFSPKAIPDLYRICLLLHCIKITQYSTILIFTSCILYKQHNMFRHTLTSSDLLYFTKVNISDKTTMRRNLLCLFTCLTWIFIKYRPHRPSFEYNVC